MDFNGTLENGVELYTCLNPNLRGFCLSLWVRRGSMHEETHGLAHMLEHVSFRCLSERLGGRLYETLARHGLSFDASTFTNYVRFEMSGPAERFAEGSELLLRMLEPPELSLEGLNLERRRVQAEIREANVEESGTARTWKGTPLARTISGTVHSTNLIGFEQLKREHARWFCRGGFFFCLTGGATGVEAFVNRLSRLRPSGEAPASEAAPVPEGFFHRNADVYAVSGDYALLRFCFDVNTARHREPAHMLLTDLLLGDLGLLYLALSEDRALVYNLDDCFERYANIGCLSFEFEVEPARLGEAADAAVNLLNRVKALDDATFEAWRTGFLALEAMEQDYICTFNNSWGYDNGLRHMGFPSADARQAAYGAVTIEELRQMAREIFTPDNLVLCAQGNTRRINTDDLRARVMRL